jgi:hypothetical protein
MQRVAALGAALILTLAGFLTFASPASAAPPAGCANQSICAYVADQYDRSEGYEWMPVRPAGTCEDVGLPNSWTSVYNNTGRSVRFYKNYGCGNGVWTLAAGSSLRNMALYQPSWNDNIQSVRF